MSKKPLSATMAITLAEAIDHGGKLVRHNAGYWCVAGADVSFDTWHSVATVDGLVDRGRMKFTEYKEGRGQRFPIVAEVIA